MVCCPYYADPLLGMTIDFIHINNVGTQERNALGKLAIPKELFILLSRSWPHITDMRLQNDPLANNRVMGPANL
jgi:hypothetical protein